MRILYVFEHFHPYIGGAENLFLNLCSEMAARGHKVQVITRRLQGTPKHEVINKVEILRIESPGRSWFALFAFPAIMKKARLADLVHTSLYSASIPAQIASHILHKPVVITVHEIWTDLWSDLPFLSWFNKMIYRWLEQVAISRKYNAYIGVSQFTKDLLVQSLGGDADVLKIYNGLDVSGQTNVDQFRL